MLRVYSGEKSYAFNYELNLLSLFFRICFIVFSFRKSWNDDLGNNNIKPAVPGQEQTVAPKPSGTDKNIKYNTKLLRLKIYIFTYRFKTV